MSHFSLVKITIFRKHLVLDFDKCRCSREATMRVIATVGGVHCHVHCCRNKRCIVEAASFATINLFARPTLRNPGPERYIKAGFEAVEDFKISFKRI